MGNENQYCGGNAQLDNLYIRHIDEIDEVVLGESALAHLNSQFGQYQRSIDERLSQLLPQSIREIEYQEETANNKLLSLKQKIIDKLGSIDLFQYKVKGTFEGYLNSKQALARFQQLKQQARSQFRTKKASIVKSLATQKQLFVKEFQKILPSSKAMDQLDEIRKKKLFKLVQQRRSKQLQQNNKVVFMAFERKVAVHLLEQNLTQLQAIRFATEHFKSTISRWGELVQAVN